MLILDQRLASKVNNLLYADAFPIFHFLHSKLRCAPVQKFVLMAWMIPPPLRNVMEAPRQPLVVRKSRLKSKEKGISKFFPEKASSRV
jgi:hypothetical protein